MPTLHLLRPPHKLPAYVKTDRQPEGEQHYRVLWTWVLFGDGALSRAIQDRVVKTKPANNIATKIAIAV